MSYSTDFLNPRKGNEVMTGKYFEYLPERLDVGFKRVSYEEIDFRETAFENVIGNLPAEVEKLAIRTHTSLKYENNAFFMAQDGKFFQVINIHTKQPKDAAKQALRFFKNSTMTEYELRMIEYDFDASGI